MNLNELIVKATTAGACDLHMNILKKYKTFKNAARDENAAYWCYWYAQNVVEGRWYDGEPIILTSPEFCYAYALYITKGRWKEGEKTILRSPYWTYWYTYDIIKKRWEEGEPVIFSHPHYKKCYCLHFNIDYK